MEASLADLKDAMMVGLMDLKMVLKMVVSMVVSTVVMRAAYLAKKTAEMKVATMVVAKVALMADKKVP